MSVNLAFYYFLTVVLLTRLFFQFRDNPLSAKSAISKTIVELLAILLLAWNPALIPLGFFLIVLNISAYFVERRIKKIDLTRLCFLLIYLILFSIIFSRAAGVGFNTALLKRIGSLETHFILFSYFKYVDWQTFLKISASFLFALNETNVLIRYLMAALSLEPRLGENEAAGAMDTREYNRGRVIGILERTLIYYFVLYGHFSAVGFILAAKGVTRFKELENRSFAEYFLIGTLSSTIIAGAIALLVKHI
ncbi:MAG: hypothetical protein ACE5GL_08580 [Calditrichia bacterium]